MFMIYFHTKYNFPSSIFFISFVTNPKYEENFCTAAILLFYTLQNINIRTLHIFQSLLPYVILGYKLKWHFLISCSHMRHVFFTSCKALTLILLTWRIWRVHNNASKWQMGFNSAFKGL